MIYIKNTTEFQIPDDTVVSLGKFDGMHRGHGRLMEYLEEKKKSGLKTVIFTFDIPPKQRIEGRSQSKVLTTNEERMQMFARQQTDYLLECPFTPEIMKMEPEAFVEWLVERLHVKSFVVGTDFRFGYNRKGDYRLLKMLADAYGYEVEVVHKVQEDGRDISSTFIREEILAGRMEKANRLLGYCYFVQGIVAHGNEIGRSLLHMPTANLLPAEEKLLPPCGVYVTRTSIESRTGNEFGGITNVGKKPTIAGSHPIGVETHLFDFDGRIYGEKIKVEFLTMVRGEKKFDSLEKLKEQMYKDREFGIKYYANITNIC